MKFIRRHDLTPHTRIEMVRLAWLNQGIYGKMTQIAQEYQISRTWLYQLIWAAHLQLETLFGDQKPHAQESPILQALQWFGKPFGEFRAELLFEVRAADMTEF